MGLQNKDPAYNQEELEALISELRKSEVPLLGCLCEREGNEKPFINAIASYVIYDDRVHRSMNRRELRKVFGGLWNKVASYLDNPWGQSQSADTLVALAALETRRGDCEMAMVSSAHWLLSRKGNQLSKEGVEQLLRGLLTKNVVPLPAPVIRPEQPENDSICC